MSNTLPAASGRPSLFVEQRGEQRHPTRHAVTWVRSSGRTRAVAENVSRRGLYLRCQEPPANRSLQQLELDPGDGQGTLSVHAVAQRSEVGEGAGLKLFALSGRTQLRWEAFVARCAAAPAARRLSHRPGGQAELLAIQLELLASGRIRVPRRALELSLGEPVVIHLRHPDRPRELRLRGVVAEHGRGAVTVETPPFDQARADILARFIGNTMEGASAVVWIDERAG